jgi:hypothetical protein
MSATARAIKFCPGFPRSFDRDGVRLTLEDIAEMSAQVSFVPISEVPDATLRRRQKQRNYSRVQSDRRGTRRVDASAMGCEAKALQRSLADEATGAMPP